MNIRKTLWLLLLLFWGLQGAVAQIDANFLRDSIEIERGIAGSTDFEPFFRLVNQTFDEGNRPLSSIIYQYLSEDELVPHQRQTFQYDEEGRKTLFLLESWDESGESWIPVRQEESSYENGNLVQFLRKKAVAGVLQNNRRWLYQYTPEGRETEKLLEGWNTDTGEWNSLSRKTTAYTADNQIALQRLERFIDGDWVNRRRRMWTWEMGQLQPTQTLSQVWSSTDEAWVNQSRKTYGMGNNGLWAGSIVEQWNPDANDWMREIKETFAINLSNNISSYELETWDGEWLPDLRSQYSYSAAENTALLQRWNTMEMQHENFLRFRALFNEEGLPIEQTGMQAWNTDATSWQNENYTRRISYFWRAATPNRTEEPIVNRCLIPNPYISGTSISCELSSLHYPLQLEVYNLFGQRLWQQQVEGPSFRVNTDALPSGLFVFKLSDQKKIYHLQKVVVAH